MVLHKQVLSITKKHTSNYPNPLKLTKGQVVLVGEKYKGNTDWDNWIYCYTEDRHSEGWVPEQIINRKENTGIIMEDYFAKELTVEPGDQVILLKELNGWYWVKQLTTSEEGWIPKEAVSKIECGF